MKILMTQRQLRYRGGSELVTIEVARELRLRGHEVAIYSPQVGDLIQTLLNAGVWVKSNLRDLPWVPDIIHGQHHLQAVAALTFFENTPAVYHSHGVKPWVEKPPVHPRILHYLVMCEWMEPRLAAEFGIPLEKVSTVANFVNTQRFSHIRKAPEKSARALIFGNADLPADELIRLEAACVAEGMTLDKIGSGYHNPQDRPEMFLQDYDLVFAIGKCALEALACGCAVITIIPGLAGQLVTPENLGKWVYSNFSPRYFTSAAQIQTDWLHGELQNYSPASLARVTQQIREEHSLAHAVNLLENIYQKAIRDTSELPPTSPNQELFPYLEMLSNEVDTMWTESIVTGKVRQQCQKLEGEKEAMREKIQSLRQRNDKLNRKPWNIAAAYLSQHPPLRWFISKSAKKSKKPANSPKK